MHGSSCTDFSIAGKQEGGDEGSGTKSSLMWQTVRIIEKIKPKFILWENVANVLSKKHIHNFEKYIEKLDELGYNSYYEVLNSKEFLIPQNRKRLFCLSVKKELDKSFEFPEKQELKLRLKDMLEDEVDEKYYLRDTQIEKIINSNFMQEKLRIQEKEWCDTLLARDYKDPKCVKVVPKTGSKYVDRKYKEFIDKKGYIPELFNPYNCSEIKEIAPTQTAQGDSITKSSTILKYDGSRTRKLTPREYWRLQGFADKQFEKAEKVCSNSQLYKQSGNSITVNVLEAILGKMIEYGYIEGGTE